MLLLLNAFLKLLVARLDGRFPRLDLPFGALVVSIDIHTQLATALVLFNQLREGRIDGLGQRMIKLEGELEDVELGGARSCFLGAQLVVEVGEAYAWIGNGTHFGE